MALSKTMGAAGALGGRSLLDGLQQNLHGTVDASQIGTDTTGIEGDGLTQAAQITPLDKEAMQSAPEGVLRSTVSEIAADAGPKPQPEVLAESGTTAQEGTVFAGKGAPSKVQGSALARETQDVQDTQNLQSGNTGFSAPESPAKKSLIGEILELFSGKAPEPDTPASGGSPAFVYSPTIQVEGSGDVKKDVEEANQIGMREFEQLMNEWLKKNKRTKFA